MVFIHSWGIQLRCLTCDVMMTYLYKNILTPCVSSISLTYQFQNQFVQLDINSSPSSSWNKKNSFFFLSQKQKWTTICTWSDTTLSVYTAYIQPHHPGHFYKCKAWNQNKARVSDWLNYDSKVKTISPVCYSNVFRVRWLSQLSQSYSAAQTSVTGSEFTVVSVSGCMCLILVTSVSVNA